MHKTLVLTALIGLLGGCGGPGRSNAEAPPAAPTDPPGASAPDPVGTSAPSPTVAVAPQINSKAALALAILGEQELGPWSVRMGYDLGLLRMLVLTRPSDAGAVTVAELTAEAPGVSDAAMLELFAGREVPAPHPFELLGYDHVVPRTSDTLQARGHDLPRLSFSWLRVDPDTGERESGRGTAIWMHCEAPGVAAKPLDGHLLLVASETPGTEHDEGPASDVAARLAVCR